MRSHTQEKVAKAKEEDEQAGPSKIRQCNEGRYEFRLEDEDGQGNVVLHLPLPKFLDNSLLSVDVHPTYITVVIKVRQPPASRLLMRTVHSMSTLRPLSPTAGQDPTIGAPRGGQARRGQREAFSHNRCGLCHTGLPPAPAACPRTPRRDTPRTHPHLALALRSVTAHR